MTTDPELAVRMSNSLYRKLRIQARQINVSVELLVASLLVDAVEADDHELRDCNVQMLAGA
jgi:predicted HicB family RNase H-like nuclease